LINSHRITSRARSSTARNRLRLKANFMSEFKLIAVVSAGPKVFLSGNQKIVFYENRKMCILSRYPASTRGAYASSRNVGRDAMDVEVPLTSGAEADGKSVWS
jgi:hypothetical protein